MHRRFQGYREGRERQERYFIPGHNFARKAAIAVGLTVLAVVLLWLAYKAIAVFFLFFAGALMAVDAKDGRRLWRFDANAHWKASPMTYVFDNRQYIAIAAGPTIISFALVDWPN